MCKSVELPVSRWELGLAIARVMFSGYYSYMISFKTVSYTIKELKNKTILSLK